MIEQIILNYLSEKFTDLNISVNMDIPKDRPQRFVVIEKTGGGKDGIYQSTFAIQSYGTSLFDAANINNMVIDFMNGLTVLNDVSRVELNSNYNFTDTASKQPRYQAVFDVWHY